MPFRTLILPLTALTIGAASLAHAQPTARAESTARAEPTIADAHRAHYLGQHAQALALYERLAAAGNAEAAERAGFLLIRGSAATCVASRDADRATVLLLQAAIAGRPGAGAMLNLLDGTD